MDDDLLAAIAAATAAAEAGIANDPEPEQSLSHTVSQASPPSPEVKREPPEEISQPGESLKRPRLPDDADMLGAGEDDREAKRTKIEDTGGMAIDMADFEQMISEAQAAAESAGNAEGTRSASETQRHVAEQPRQLPHETGHDLEIHEADAAIQAILSGLPKDMDDSMGNEHFGPDATAQPTSSNSSIWSNQKHYARTNHTLPSLRRAAVDVIRALSEQPMEDTVNTLFDTETTEPGLAREYAELKSYFDWTRKFISDSSSPLSAEQLGIQDPEQRDILRLSNIASLCADMFSAGRSEADWLQSDQGFMDIFVRNEDQLDPDVAELYVALKTQRFLSVVELEPEQNKERSLDDIFPLDLEESLKKRHPNLPLATSEIVFIEEVKTRRTMLLNESRDSQKTDALLKQFDFSTFLDTLGTFLNDNIGSLEKLGTGQTSVDTIIDEPVPDESSDAMMEGFDLEAALAEASRAAMQAFNMEPEVTGTDADTIHQAGSSHNAASQVPQGSHQHQYQPSSSRITASVSTHGQVHQQTQNHQYPHDHGQHYAQHSGASAKPAVQGSATAATAGGGDSLPPNQSASSPALYERARQVAASRSSTHTRREGTHSTRRPWSPEEEKALMMGLDMVKGPHWSQILGLFGVNGAISNILADRTQVQLKDKARNLKLFFLKTNSEMPFYLQSVTGELKTRAPTQAARKEAEERARLNSEDEQARMNGIMALGDLQNGSMQRSSQNPTTARPPAPTSQAAAHTHPSAPSSSHVPGQPSLQRGNTASNVPGIAATQATGMPSLASRGQAQSPGQSQSQFQSQSHAHGQTQTQQQQQVKRESQDVSRLSMGQGVPHQQVGSQAPPRPAPQTQAQHQQPSARPQPQAHAQGQSHHQAAQQQQVPINSQHSAFRTALQPSSQLVTASSPTQAQQQGQQQNGLASKQQHRPPQTAQPYHQAQPYQKVQAHQHQANQQPGSSQPAQVPKQPQAQALHQTQSSQLPDQSRGQQAGAAHQPGSAAANNSSVKQEPGITAEEAALLGIKAALEQEAAASSGPATQTTA